MRAATLLPTGFTILRTEIQQRSRPLEIDLWYPAEGDSARSTDPGPGETVMAVPDAPPLGDAAPLIVLSHGVYGSARSYSWISGDLARHGFIVAGISHYGESPVYGPHTIDSTAVLKPWERPLDCTAALDYVLSHPRFGRIADPMKIGALGHSSGGAAVLALAGAVYDPQKMREYCRSGGSKADRCCPYPSRLSPQDDGRARRSWRDERVRAVAALDPSLGPGYSARSLARVEVPVHIVASVENDFLPFEHNAGRYARLIPGASLTPLAHGEGHFVFIDECGDEAEVQGVPVCRDRDGVRRTAVHARLAEILGRFFTEHLM
jgi:predicted dienelactone hydrolase